MNTKSFLTQKGFSGISNATLTDNRKIITNENQLAKKFNNFTAEVWLKREAKLSLELSIANKENI